MKEKKKLNSKTPHWFRDWHMEHFNAVKDRTFRNEKLIYLILAAIVAASIFGGDTVDAVAKIISSIGG